MYPSSPFMSVLHELWDFVFAGFTYSSPRHAYTPLRLESGVYYDARHPDTAQLRLLLTEQFKEQDLARPLQPSEYALFALLEMGYQVPCEARHWQAGQWHHKLKGSTGVRVSVKPQMGSVIEFFTDTNIGKIGVVTQVTKDETLTIQAVGITAPSVFSSYDVPREQWIEFGAVFTNFVSASTS